MGDVRLGWQNPSGSALSGPDAVPLRRLFESLSLWLSFPLIGLSRAAMPVATGVVTPVAWTTEIYDEHQLHDTNATTFRVPSAHQSYLAIGLANAFWPATVAAGSTVSATWAINGVASVWAFGQVLPAPFGSNTPVSFMQRVSRGQTLSVTLFHLSGDPEVADVTAWMMFLPMGS